MISLRARSSWIYPQNCKENGFLYQYKPNHLKLKNGKVRNWFGLRVVMGITRRVGDWESKDEEEGCGILEEEKRFVEGLREAQPYIFAHRDKTLVVVLSSEIIASPVLDFMIKVPLCLPFFFFSLMAHFS